MDFLIKNDLIEKGNARVEVSRIAVIEGILDVI